MLNNSPFEFDTRDCSRVKIGGNVERTLSAKAIKDNIAIKKEWKFVFFVNDTGLLRLERIFDLNSTISLRDIDSRLYTVICSNTEFLPKELVKGYYSVELNFVEA